MIYDIKTQQWELIDSETPLYGHELIAQIISSGREILGATKVMSLAVGRTISNKV